jgi:hypothetical protein
MRKEIELPETFATGEPTIQLVMTRGRTGQRLLEKRAFDTAAESPALEYIKTVMPEEGCTIILVNALGAYETYDDNKNGDSFPNKPVHIGRLVRCGHRSCQRDAWVRPDEVLSKHYKSFENGAGIFKHHQNKDIKKSLGDVMKAFWNEKMQRVELLLRIVNARDPQLVERINDGEYPAVSMGCRIAADVCSICGHRAATRREYCEHARTKLRQILPNGEKVCVHNPAPKFFDISFVLKPADPTGYMLKKVAYELQDWCGHSAELGERLDEQEAKLADARKLSEIRKQITGQIMGAKSNNAISKYVKVTKNRPNLTPEQIDLLAQYPTNKVAASFLAAGVPLSTQEIAKIFFKRAGIVATQDDLDRIEAVQPLLTTAFSVFPHFEKAAAKTVGFDPTAIDEKLVKTALSYHQAWSYASNGPLSIVPPQNIGPGALYRAAAPPKTDILTMTDPVTGHQYMTTRGAAQSAKHQITKNHLIRSATLGALFTAGLNKLIGNRLSWKIKIPLTLPVGAYLGHKTQQAVYNMVRPTRNPYYITDQGIKVPGNTEFTKASSLEGPGISELVDKLMLDDTPGAVSRLAISSPNSLLVKIANDDPVEIVTDLFSENTPTKVMFDTFSELINA